MSPIQNDFVQTGKPMDVKVKIKNGGPSNLEMSDTIIMTLLYDGDSVISGGKPMQKWYQGFMKPGDEVNVDFYTGLNQNYNNGGVHKYCVDLWLRNRSTTVGAYDQDLSNNRSCHDVYITTFNNGVQDKNVNAGNSINIKAAPVPCTNSLSLTYSVPQSGEGKMVITDILGKEVLSMGNEFIMDGTHIRSLDVSSLPAGIYFVSLNINGATVSVKFIKQ